MLPRLEIPRLAALRTWHWSALLVAVLAAFLFPLHPEPQAAQRASGPIRPSPGRAGQDVPPPLREGCMVGKEGTESAPCLYGDPHGRRTLYLFGDSHALQHFPALQAVAERNHWRLYVLTKRECTPAEATIRSSVVEGQYSSCDAWRQNTLKRIERSGRRSVVALSTLTSYHAFGPGGEELSGSAASAALQHGYVATLRRLQRAGLGLLVIRDTPEAPTNIPACVAAHLSNPRACAFAQPHRWVRNFDLRAARRTGVGVLSAWPKICSHDLCRAVVKRILVYRDNAHITATFSRSLNRWFEPGLKRAFGR